MNEERFWEIVNESGRDIEFDVIHAEAFLKSQKAKLATILGELPGDEIRQFSEIYHENVDRLVTRDIWAVFYVIDGGGSLDGFHYFRYWIVGMAGRFSIRRWPGPIRWRSILN